MDTNRQTDKPNLHIDSNGKFPWIIFRISQEPDLLAVKSAVRELNKNRFVPLLRESISALERRARVS